MGELLVTSDFLTCSTIHGTPTAVFSDISDSLRILCCDVKHLKHENESELPLNHLSMTLRLFMTSFGMLRSLRLEQFDSCDKLGHLAEFKHKLSLVMTLAFELYDACEESEDSLPPGQSKQSMRDEEESGESRRNSTRLMTMKIPYQLLVNQRSASITA